MRYIVSSLLVATDLKSGIIQNTQSGERFEVTAEVLKLLSCFKGPRTIEDALRTVDAPRGERRRVREFLKRLRDERILARIIHAI